MKILAICHSAVLSVNQIFYQHLVDKNNKVALVVPRKWPSGGLREDYRYFDNPLPNLKIIPVKTLFSGNGSLYMIKSSIKKIIKDESPDIIFLDEEPWSLVALQTLLALRSYKNIPFYFYTKQNIYKKYPWPFSWIEKKTYFRSKLVFSISAECTKVLQKKGYKKKIIYFPHAVETNQFSPNQIKRENIFTVGYIGRFVPEKGGVELIEAIASLIKKGLEIKLIMVGGGKERQAWETLSKDLFIQAEFIPSVSHDKVQEVYHKLHLLCLPSKTTPFWKEQFGRVLIEAAACKVAVLGSNSGEIPNVIKMLNNGLIFQEGDSSDLANKLENIYQDKKLRVQLEESGYKIVTNMLSYQSIVEKFLDITKN